MNKIDAAGLAAGNRSRRVWYNPRRPPERPDRRRLCRFARGARRAVPGRCPRCRCPRRARPRRLTRDATDAFRPRLTSMSLNDPQWGKRGGGGPPDLDEIWRNVNRRINDLFGRKGGTGGDEPGGGRQAPGAARCPAPAFSRRWSSSSGSRAASTSSTKAVAASSRASASTPRPRRRVRAGICRSRSRRRSSSISRRCGRSRSAIATRPRTRRRTRR